MKKDLTIEEADQILEEREAVQREYAILYSLISSAVEMVEENGTDGEKLSYALMEQERRFQKTIKKYKGIDLSEGV